MQIFTRFTKFVAISVLVSCLIGLLMALDGCSYSFSLMPPSGDPDFCGSYSGRHIGEFLTSLFGDGLIALVMFIPFSLVIGIFGSNVILVGMIFSYFWLKYWTAKGVSFSKLKYASHVVVFVACYLITRIAILDSLLRDYIL